MYDKSMVDGQGPPESKVLVLVFTKENANRTRWLEHCVIGYRLSDNASRNSSDSTISL